MKKQFYFAKMAVFFALMIGGTQLAQASCDPVVSLTGTATSCSTATFSFAPSMGAMDYQYVISTSTTAPSGPGTSTMMMTSGTATGLMASTIYYLFVRTDCGMGMYSSWVGPYTISTPACASSCTAPSMVGSSAVSCDTVMLGWMAVSGATGYEYKVDMSSGSPSGSGTATTSTMPYVGGLTGSTTYYAHVRSSCGSGSYSSWTTSSSFTTPACAAACAAPAGLTTTPTGHKVTLNWTAATGMMGYEYVVNTTTVNPTTAGTAVTTNTAIVNGLMPSTTYYVHMRTKCSSTTFSPWGTAQSFSTTPGVGVNTVNGADMGINFYPNPAANNVMLEVDGIIGSSAQLELSGIDGRIVRTIAIKGNRTSIDLSGLGNGLYIARYTDGGNMQIARISKQ